MTHREVGRPSHLMRGSSVQTSQMNLVLRPATPATTTDMLKRWGDKPDTHSSWSLNSETMSLSQKYQKRQDDYICDGVRAHRSIGNHLLCLPFPVCSSATHVVGHFLTDPVGRHRWHCPSVASTANNIVKQAPTTQTPPCRLRRHTKCHRHTTKQQMTVGLWCVSRRVVFAYLVVCARM